VAPNRSSGRRIGLNRLVGFASAPAVRQFQLRRCVATAMTINLRTTGSRTPILRFTVEALVVIGLTSFLVTR
jgi:hypothetical protein